jgi:hypothetical protein
MNLNPDEAGSFRELCQFSMDDKCSPQSAMMSSFGCTKHGLRQISRPVLAQDLLSHLIDTIGLFDLRSANRNLAPTIV